MSKKTDRYTRTPEQRFMAFIEKQGSCWLWTGSTNDGGYGQFGYQGKVVLAHRFSPAGMGKAIHGTNWK